MPAKDHSSPARLAKRSRASDAAIDNMQLKQERTKRRRTSTDEGGGEAKGQLKSLSSEELSQSLCRHEKTGNVVESGIERIASTESNIWCLSRCIAGQFLNLDPVLTPDEQ